jgi:hypothetical protein
MVLECKSDNIGSDVVDMIARLPKTAGKYSAAYIMNLKKPNYYSEIKSPEQCTCMLLRRISSQLE